MMDDLDAQIDLAENFLRAGNINRAESLCKEVLDKRHDDLGAFLCLFDVHLARDDFQKASELCDWRLARCPECPESHICKLVAFGTLSARDVTYDHVRRIDGENFMFKLRQRLSNYPLKLARAEILHSVYFQDPRDTLRLIDKERLSGRLDPEWLKSIESRVNVHSGNTRPAKDALLKTLAENPQDAEALHDLSVTYFYSGRLFSAIKYARRAKRIAPLQSAKSQEVIIASLIGLFPFFWLGQIIITLTIFITSKIDEDIAWPLRFGGILAVAISYGKILSGVINLKSGGQNILLLMIIGLGLWAGYILFYFGEIGHKLSGQDKSIKLSKKY
jgi:tetratricopeptide (TPR) repeat protein